MDRDPIDPDVLDSLRRAGLEPGAVLGAGVEGVVLEVGDGLVAKVWRGASRESLLLLRRFYEAVELDGLATPRIVEVLELPDAVVGIEWRLPGRPLRADLGPVVPLIDESHVRAVVQSLAALRSAPIRPDLDLLPLLPGESPPGTPDGFENELASLIRQRTRRSARVLLADLPDLDRLVAATCEALLGLAVTRRALVHGDLIPANVHVDAHGDPVAVLDFGFLTTVGDPAFDCAVAASIYDMWGPHARSSEAAIDEATTAAFGHEQERLLVHRAAYGLLTATSFSADGTDGHYRWCVAMLRRPDVRAALDLAGP